MKRIYLIIITIFLTVLCSLLLNDKVSVGDKRLIYLVSNGYLRSVGDAKIVFSKGMKFDNIYVVQVLVGTESFDSLNSKLMLTRRYKSIDDDVRNIMEEVSIAFTKKPYLIIDGNADPNSGRKITFVYQKDSGIYIMVSTS
jgi:hypothetical protein